MHIKPTRPNFRWHMLECEYELEGFTNLRKRRMFMLEIDFIIQGCKPYTAISNWLSHRNMWTRMRLEKNKLNDNVIFNLNGLTQFIKFKMIYRSKRINLNNSIIFFHLCKRMTFIYNLKYNTHWLHGNTLYIYIVIND